jgi:hypothetical protein
VFALPTTVFPFIIPSHVKTEKFFPFAAIKPENHAATTTRKTLAEFNVQILVSEQKKNSKEN